MTDDRWVAIDFETATREPTSACALGVALIDGLEVVETASWLIRPPFNEYEFWNTHVHGICAQDTELAPDFDELWWEIGPLLRGPQASRAQRRFRHARARRPSSRHDRSPRHATSTRARSRSRARRCRSCPSTRSTRCATTAVSGSCITTRRAMPRRAPESRSRAPTPWRRTRSTRRCDDARRDVRSRYRGVESS